MPNQHAENLNRTLLGKQGLVLNVEDYVRTVAVMGMEIMPYHTKQGSGEHVLTWTLGAFHKECRRVRRLDLLTLAPLLIAAWKSFLKESWRIRVSLPGVKLWGARYNPIDVLDILRHPAVGLTSAWIEWNSHETDLKWRWPIRVGAFEGDFADLELKSLVQSEMWPANKLTQPLEINRENSRVEVLVQRADLRAALTRILTLKHRVRAGLVLLIAQQDLPWESVRPYIDTLLAETQAGGIAIVQANNDIQFCNQLNGLMAQLSHNRPLDVAMSKVFGADLTSLVLDRRLLKATELNQGFMAAASLLKELPHKAVLAQAEFSGYGSFKLAWRDDEPVSDLAKELNTRAKEESIPYNAESEGAAALSEIMTAARNAKREQAVEERPRYMQSNVYRFVDSEPIMDTRGFVVDAPHALDVFISAEVEGQLKADVQVPLQDIDWGKLETVSLQVMLAEPNQWENPLRGTLHLPRHGRSSTHRFLFVPTRPGTFQGRVTLYYRGRVLQTALLEAQVVKFPNELDQAPSDMPKVTLRVEAELRRSFGTLDERRRFDACIVCNHTATRQAAITAAGQDGAFISSLTKLKTPIANINSLLTQVAQDAERYRKGLTTDDNAELLGRLAVEGNALFRNLVIDYIDRSTAAKAIRDADYLQIVTMDPDSIVPLEFVYDYPVPKENAPVCEHAKKALENGRCSLDCRPERGPAAHVCPLGFWGLRKVIERHIHVPELDKAAKIIVSEPITGRDQLPIGSGVLLGLSKEVSSPGAEKLLAAIKRINSTKVTQVKTWNTWIKAIAKDKPDMLVLLPHADGAEAQITLEIGGDTTQSIYVDSTYVHADSVPPPLTVLLGCDTANTADTATYLSHVSVFRQADAAIVLGTIATVFGEHAAGMSARLLKCIDESIKSRPGRFGEALLKAKQIAVSKSEMIGLCLVAFGDADWEIIPKKE